MRRKVTTEEELANAISNDGIDEIEIDGDLKTKIVRIKAKGNVAWAVAVGAIAVAVILVLTSPTTGGTHSLAALPALAPSIGILGVASTVSAVKIAVAASSIAILAYIREEMNVVDEGEDFIVLKKEDAKKYSSFTANYKNAKCDSLSKADVLFRLGVNYYEGINDMPQNKDMALYCLKQAAAFGSEHAKQYLWSQGYQFEGSEYNVLKKKNAKNYSSFTANNDEMFGSDNRADTLFKLGVNYFEGVNDMPQDKDMALYCLKQAAVLGSERAKQYLWNQGYQFF